MRAITIVASVVLVLSQGRSEAIENEFVPPPSAIIALQNIKLTAARISVEARELSPESITCDIGVSSELNESPVRMMSEAVVFTDGKARKPATARAFKIVASDFRVGEPSLHVVFPVGISKVDLGLRVEFKQGRGNRRAKLDLYIRPRFKLPSGNEYPFTELGHESACRLQTLRAQKEASNRDEMSRLLLLGQRMGKLDRYRRYRELDEENIRLQTNIRQDEDALESILKYWVNTANDASVYVRFAADGVMLPAEVTFVK